MKLYVFSSGWLGPFDKSLLQTGATGQIRIPVAFFLIHHPKGNVLFDTGNNDTIIKDPSYWGPLFNAYHPDRSPNVSTVLQLEKTGFKATDINYVIVGHMHLDHAGNMLRFPNATLVYQRDEIVNAFWPKPGFASSYITGDFAALRAPTGNAMPTTRKVIELNGDLDLFGDGSVYIKRQVAHTPGSEMLVVRLPKTGTVILTSDDCYLMENLKKNLLPTVSLAYDPAGMIAGYEWIKERMDAEKADVIFAHDPEVFKAHKHAPEYYE
jgi:glyoxylase-like metal-dependent hydrolase (beta-lactamase superfamily II)